MPITKKDYDEGNFKTYRGATIKIIEFLKTNKDNAYTSKEIAEAVGASQSSATIALRNLIKSGIAEKKRPYYTYIVTSQKKKASKKEEESEEEEEENIE